jgi:uncharacterized membrane protein
MNKALHILILVVLILFLFVPLSTYALSYDVAIKDNGEAIFIITVEEESANITLPKDAAVKGKGILYVISETEKEKQVSVYTQKKGILVASTFGLTQKSGSQWVFNYDFNAPGRIVLPKDALISSITPTIQISEQIIKLESESPVSLTYNYTPGISLHSNSIKTFITFLIFALIITIALIIYLITRKSKDQSQQNVIKILSQNERKVIKFIIEKGGTEGKVKRNTLEKEGKFSKSSLANSLNILEKKNIITIDKSYTTHTVNLTDWFRRLH